MKLSLYDDFNYLNDFNNVWLISDTHFGDNENEMYNWPSDEERLKLINSKVSKKDCVIHLGDVGDIEFARKIKGEFKILITGNHDHKKSYYKRQEQFKNCIDENGIDHSDELKQQPDFKCFINIDGNKIAYYDNHLFDFVYDGPVFISPKILLSHEPVNLNFGLNIHGHCHSSEKYEYWNIDKKGRVNIAADVVDFEPQRLDKIVEQFKVIDLHRVTVDKATKESQGK